MQPIKRFFMNTKIAPDRQRPTTKTCFFMAFNNADHFFISFLHININKQIIDAKIMNFRKNE